MSVSSGFHAGEEGQRRWLAYNAVGGVNTRQDDGFNAVEVVLHDSARSRRRPPILNDFYFFSMAALGPQVCQHPACCAMGNHARPCKRRGRVADARPCWHKDCR